MDKMMKTEKGNSRSSEQGKAITHAVALIEKQFGKGSIMRLDESPNAGEIEVISTGSLSLDIALGVGGVPRGRIVEIFGPESSGKTTLTLHIAAEAQRAGGVVAFVDAEHALDVGYSKKIGVDPKALIVSQPDNGEQALEIVDMLVNSGKVDLVIVDSVAALTPKIEIEGEMSDQQVGVQARLMSKALRKLTASVSRCGCTIIFINQIRMKIGVMFGNPETTTGGNALKFYTSVRMDIRRTSAIKQGDMAVGNRTRVRVVKNKVAPPFREAEFDIMFGQGISAIGDVIDLAAKKSIIDKSGAWFSYKGKKLGQGRENVKKHLQEDSAMLNEIIAAVKTAHGLSKPDKQGKNKQALH